MIDPVKWLTDMFNYGDWVTERLLNGVAEADLGSNERINFIFNHVHNARRVWLERVRDGEVTYNFDAMNPLSEIAQQFPLLTAEWCTWLDEGGAGRLESLCAYQNLRGDAFEHKVYLIAQHVINHTTHHYHEVSALIRASGNVPPQTDYIAYVRLNKI